MIQSLAKKTLSGLPDKAPPARRKLVSELAAQIPSEDAEHFDQGLMARMMNAHWMFSKKRGEGDPQIDVYYATVKGHRKTVIDAVSDDMAFLVDSIVAEINRNHYLIDLLVHPIFFAKYGRGGELLDISDKPGEGYERRSHIHVHIRNTLSEQAQESLRSALMAALADVAVCNRDWKKMLDNLKAARNELSNAKTGRPRPEIERYCAFLDYLHNNNFTLLGYREYKFIHQGGAPESRTVKGKSLGLLHDDVRPAYISESREGLPRNLRELRLRLPPVSVSKTNRLSTVHRRVPMDAIAIKTYDAKGEIAGEKLFLGLFTSVTYSRSVGDVPYLREKVEEALEASKFLPGSHNSKALRHILEKYPRDELFQIETEELLRICLDILRLQERQRIAIFMRRDPFGRYISCLVYVPRDRFGTTLRKKITQILETELKGVCSNFYTNMDDSVFARIMYTIDIDQANPPKYDEREIEGKIREAGQIWAERLSVALTETISDEEEITRLTLKYGEAFPVAYASRYRARQAVFDIEKIEDCLAKNALTLDLYSPQDESESHLRLKVYNPDRPLNLSDVLPILENMDLRAVSELPFEVKATGETRAVWIHDFLLETSGAAARAQAQKAKAKFEQAFAKIWYREVENDGLNALVVRGGLDYREIIILRTYVRYMRQIGSPFSRAYIENALVENPRISELLAKMFAAVHDPAEKRDRSAIAASYDDKIYRELEKVESLDQDRILRAASVLVLATLRTNYFQTQPDGQPKPYLSIKLDCSKIPDLPEPRPYREIFVYSPRVEAVHLRGDKIARGGIRWSDRHEDFRTEVLGLMKAQTVKNAIIVPMGAKGGFIVKSPLKDRAALQKEGVECYKILVRGLLDITDNLKGEKVIPPKNVARLDGDDPYLVVAADKGTATFSDTANAISKEYDFWLGDAFASGGSAGYDHKKIGITARGAWESVKQHFRQLNHDTQSKPFDAVGVGDMAGDVFGNGMLLTPHIRLIGAFNHAHVFCDPAPDPALSFKERRRMFENGLGWDQYDSKKLSRGGRVYSRNEKTLQLTPEIQKRFDLPKDKVTPAELIRAILKARADLLYLGGIGTFVKSSKQMNAEVGDKGNEPLRVDAAELRVKVVGEGANLGFTQLGRVEFAEKGGRINTDFLDNSGGVDTSDHEVNIKILLLSAMGSRAAAMSLESRNNLLRRMTDEVAEQVLRDNYQQSLAISLAEQQARETLKEHEELMKYLKARVGLSRTLEGLPGSKEVERRMRLGKGLTRPELCVLLAYSKIVFTQDLLATSLPDSKDMQQWAINYFPAALRGKFEKEIARHKLRREIIAMSVANSIVNRMGPSFVMNCAASSGADSEAIARAYVSVREIFGLRSLWDSVEGLDNKVPAEMQLKSLRDIARLADHAVMWLLANRTQDINSYGACVDKLAKDIGKLLTEELREQMELRVRSAERDGLPRELARKIAALPFLSSACDIAKIAIERKADPEKAAKAYFEIGTRFHFDWLRQQAGYLQADTRWQAEAVSSLIGNLYRCQAEMAAHVLKEGGLAKWLAARARVVAQIQEMFGELRQSGTIDLSMLVIAEQRLRALYEA